jgi:hypothetical protein
MKLLLRCISLLLAQMRPAGCTGFWLLSPMLASRPARLLSGANTGARSAAKAESRPLVVFGSVSLAANQVRAYDNFT